MISLYSPSGNIDSFFPLLGLGSHTKSYFFLMAVPLTGGGVKALMALPLKNYCFYCFPLSLVVFSSDDYLFTLEKLNIYLKNRKKEGRK